jgi:dTDP-4-dehydrorhamnose reductase
MLGHKVCQVLSTVFEVYGTFRSAVPNAPRVYENTTPILDVDVTRHDSLERAISAARPDVVVNAVGIVKQLALAKDPISSIEMNSLLPHFLARLGGDRGFKVVHISTDCVFSGRKGVYTETDIPDPLDLYGRSKLLGELDGPGVLTLRTSIIGRELQTQNGLVEWFLSQRGGTVNGFGRAIYTGLTTEALSQIIVSILQSERPLHGLWHVSSEAISKYDLLQKLNAAFSTGTTILRDDSFVCDRSLDSARFWASTGLRRPLWADMISAMANDPTPYRSSAG